MDGCDWKCPLKIQLKKTSTTVFIAIFSAILCLTLIGSAQSRRDKRDQPEKLMDIAGVKPGMSIGEAGAGRGYLTFHLSRRVGEMGRIYANDIDKKSLQYIIDRCEREGVKNIETVLGEIADPCYPVTDLDMVVMIYAFHDFTEKEEWLKNVKKYMKKDASVVIFDGQDAHIGMNEELVANLGRSAGFQLVHHDKIHGGLWVYILRIK
jgi:ubiquinone/menaquinone biosynthesis C-methylase UbiE